MTLIGEPPSPGQIVRVRQRQYLVEDVVRPPRPGDKTLVRLACVDDDAQGEPLEVLWEMEVDPEVLRGESWERLTERGFDPAEQFAAYFHTLRWNCVTSTDARLFQSPFRAGIRIDAYQLEPLRKALLLPRVNLFIADDVGLGKTIEAGLIARELLYRKKVRDIVVSAPPSVIHQWQDELENRFGLTFVVVDREYVRCVREERGYGVNPWTTHARFLISHRLLIDEDYAGPLRDWLRETGSEMRQGSLLILDEAHHAAPSSGSRYAIDTKITRAVRDLAWRFEHRLFLSATPHNGHSNSFSALLEILDPLRFCRGVPVRGKKLLEDVMVRRLKEDVREVQGGFPKRNVCQVDIDGLSDDAPELELSRLLDEYRNLREERLEGESKRKRAAAGLLVTNLQQRLLSSIEAFARTLRVHRKTVLRQWNETEEQAIERSGGQLDLLSGGLGSDDDRAEVSEEELATETDAQTVSASLETAPSEEDRGREQFAREQALLERMSDVAEEARGQPDAKVRHLIQWIAENMCAGASLDPGAKPKGAAPWNDTRVIIFTEWDDTKRYLREQLEGAIAGTDRASERIEVYHGPTPPAKREDIKRAFNGDPETHPVRILIATDAAREGLNLQTRCWNLFHFDLPWNPSRLEQRNGRIDRKLQPRDEVFCRYFVYLQRPEDRVLKVLVRKTETVKRELGSLSQVVDGRLSEVLHRQGIRHAEVERLETEIEQADLDASAKETVAAELEEARERQDDLEAQIECLRNRVDQARKWIGLRDDAFRSTISSALALMGAPPLRVVTEEGSKVDRFEFPALDQREGADPTWADTMDTLRAPRRRDQKPWEWRRDAPIRPVIFEDPGTMDDDVVHLHLEQRVVQRLLGRFLAQGFVHHDLSRACLAQTKDAIPRVVLLGRLCLYGPGAARLHEEIVPITARWVFPDKREGALTPYARDAEQRTLDLLDEALTAAHDGDVSATIAQRLQSTAPRDLEELRPHLEDRGAELGRLAEQRLSDRGEQEANALKALLEAQRKRIAVARKQYKEETLLLPGVEEAIRKAHEEEIRQLRADRRHWSRRLEALDDQLESEPTAVRALYEVQARRLEPVGLVYLWPVTG